MKKTAVLAKNISTPARTSAALATNFLPPAKNIGALAKTSVVLAKNIILLAKICAPPARTIAPLAKNILLPAKTGVPLAKNIPLVAKNIPPLAKLFLALEKTFSSLARMFPALAENIVPLARTSAALAKTSAAPSGAIRRQSSVRRSSWSHSPMETSAGIGHYSGEISERTSKNARRSSSKSARWKAPAMRSSLSPVGYSFIAMMAEIVCRFTPDTEARAGMDQCHSLSRLTIAIAWPAQIGERLDARHAASISAGVMTEASFRFIAPHKGRAFEACPQCYRVLQRCRRVIAGAGFGFSGGMPVQQVSAGKARTKLGMFGACAGCRGFDQTWLDLFFSICFFTSDLDSCNSDGATNTKTMSDSEVDPDDSSESKSGLARFVDEHIDWTVLREFGKSSVLRSSYFWFLFVPLAARLIAQIERPMKINLFGQVHSFHILLPFSWYDFYFAATAFAAATLLYSFFCPKIINEYANYKACYLAGNGAVYLQTELVAIPGDVSDEKLRHDLLYSFKTGEMASGKSRAAEEWLNENGSSATPKLFDVKDLISASLCLVKREEMGDLFAVIYRAHAKRRRYVRAIIASLHGIGFFFVAKVLFANLSFVLGRYFQ